MISIDGGGFSSWIFKEAMQVLKQLPDSPKDYRPYTDFITGKSGVSWENLPLVGLDKNIV